MRIVKMFCDYCNKEYSSDKITCLIQYVQWNRFKKDVRPEAVQKDYCTFCQDKIVKCIEDLRTKEAVEETKSNDNELKLS